MSETMVNETLLSHLLRLFEPDDPAARDQAYGHVAALLAAQERGDTAVEVSDQDRNWLAGRPWVGDGARPTPVVLQDQLLQFHIYWQAEREILARLKALAQEAPSNVVLSDHFKAQAQAKALDPEKLVQIERALAQPLTLLTGGPGTGKTTMLAWLLAALLQQQPEMTIALAAPTGKAAQRMKEALDKALPKLPLSQGQKHALQALMPGTLHRLLGIGGTPQPRHDPDNPLEHDLVVVDEASMVDVLTLSKLVRALRPGSRLILMGDPNQLASVEAGNVLADLTRCFPQAHCQLTRSHRFNPQIGALADAVLAGDDERAWTCLKAEDMPALKRLPLEANAFFKAALEGFSEYLQKLEMFHDAGREAVAAQAESLIQALETFRILTPLRYHSRWGTEALNRQLIRRLGFKPLSDTLHVGQPILIQENDYSQGLFNGDQGVILPLSGMPVAWFSEQGRLRAIPVSQLPRWETALAMTVHKAQGAEFSKVLFLLPQEETPIATRELIYTALTRAKEAFWVFGERLALKRAVNRPTKRHSSLTIAR